MSYFLELLHKNFHLKFTGKVNALSKNTKLIGTIFFRSGIIVQSQWEKYSGIEALMNIFYILYNKVNDLQLVLEPEIVPLIQHELQLCPEKAIKLFKNFLIELKQVRKLSPGRTTLFQTQANYTSNQLSSIEFEALCGVIDHPNISELFSNTKLSEKDLIFSINSLKQKGLICEANK